MAVWIHTVAAQIFTHRYEVSSRQRSILVGWDVKNETYDIRVLSEKGMKNYEYNITYHGGRYR